MHTIGHKLIRVGRWLLSGLPVCCLLIAIVISLPPRFVIGSPIGSLAGMIPILLLVAEPAFVVGLVLLVIGLLCRRVSKPPARPEA